MELVGELLAGRVRGEPGSERADVADQLHAGVWALTLVGLAMLWRAGSRPDVPWSGETFVGALFMGWGLFNLVEGVIDHQLLGVHHVYEYTPNKLPWDLGFLAVGGVAMLVVGWLITKAGRNDAAPRGGVNRV